MHWDRVIQPMVAGITGTHTLVSICMVEVNEYTYENNLLWLGEEMLNLSMDFRHIWIQRWI